MKSSTSFIFRIIVKLFRLPGSAFILGASLMGAMGGFAVSSLQAQTSLLPVDPKEREQRISKPKNLARSHSGATAQVQLADEGNLPLESESDGKSIEDSLLGDDATLAYELPSGRSHLIIDLGASFTLNRVRLGSGDLEGILQCALSNLPLPPDDPRWNVAEEALRIDPDSAPELTFSPADARYVRLTIDSSSGGSFAGLAIFGQSTIEDVSSAGASPAGNASSSDPDGSPVTSISIPVNLANLHHGSTITLISSENSLGAHTMIDDDLGSGFSFPAASSEAAFVLDLSRGTTPRQLNMLLEGGNGEVQLYAFSTMPEELLPADPNVPVNSSSVILGSEFFSAHEPFIRFPVEGERTLIRRGFEERSVRFLLFRWVGEGPSLEPLTVYEINLIGDLPRELAMVDVAPRFEFADASQSAQAAQAALAEAASLLPSPPTNDTFRARPVVSP